MSGRSLQEREGAGPTGGEHCEDWIERLAGAVSKGRFLLLLLAGISFAQEIEGFQASDDAIRCFRTA